MPFIPHFATLQPADELPLAFTPASKLKFATVHRNTAL